MDGDACSYIWYLFWKRFFSVFFLLKFIYLFIYLILIFTFVLSGVLMYYWYSNLICTNVWFFFSFAFLCGVFKWETGQRSNSFLLLFIFSLLCMRWAGGEESAVECGERCRVRVGSVARGRMAAPPFSFARCVHWGIIWTSKILKRTNARPRRDGLSIRYILYIRYIRKNILVRWS